MAGLLAKHLKILNHDVHEFRELHIRVLGHSPHSAAAMATPMSAPMPAMSAAAHVHVAHSLIAIRVLGCGGAFVNQSSETHHQHQR
jgi:hypothetical protein